MSSAIAKYESMRSRKPEREAAQQEASSFQQDFEIVAEFYRLRECNEYEQALAAARDDKAGAKKCYASIAASLRRDNTAYGINERIKARIELEKKAAK